MPGRSAEHYYRAQGVTACYTRVQGHWYLVAQPTAAGQRQQRPYHLQRAYDRRNRGPYLLLLLYHRAATDPAHRAALQISDAAYRQICAFIEALFGADSPAPAEPLRLDP